MTKRAQKVDRFKERVKKSRFSRITKPKPWRGGVQAIRETGGGGCPTPRAERKEQWQVCPDPQKDNARPRKPGEHKLAAEGPWQITGQVVERAAKGNKKTTGVGTRFSSKSVAGPQQRDMSTSCRLPTCGRSHWQVAGSSKQYHVFSVTKDVTQ